MFIRDLLLVFFLAFPVFAADTLPLLEGVINASMPRFPAVLPEAESE